MDLHVHVPNHPPGRLRGAVAPVRSLALTDPIDKDPALLEVSVFLVAWSRWGGAWLQRCSHQDSEGL